MQKNFPTFKKKSKADPKLFATNAMHQNLFYIYTEYQNTKGYLTMKKQVINEHMENIQPH